MNIENIPLENNRTKGTVKVKGINNLRRKEIFWGYFFTFPAILGLLIWTIGPMLASL
jgi:multiple sugar transport system permease protein